MLLEKIAFKSFRNLSDGSLLPSDNITVLLGRNAQGKTNSLEAIHICCAGRSHRTFRDRELIKFGCEAAYLEAVCRRNDGRRKIEIGLSQSNKKSIRINYNPAKRLGELMGNMTGVMFSPEDLSLVKDGPSWRRRFLDMALSQIEPGYFYALQSYQQALLQRNTLLKTKCGIETLPVWDESLAEYGAKLIAVRRDFAYKLTAKCAEVHASITGGRENLEIEYDSIHADGGEGELRSRLLEVLEKGREGDLRQGVTRFGPHRDDLMVGINGLEARIYASQGQQRTAALSLKLAEVGIMKELTGEAPLLLLDDVFSELDAQRREWLLEHISGVQTFITAIDFDGAIFKRYPDIRVLHVEDGKISE